MMVQPDEQAVMPPGEVICREATKNATVALPGFGGGVGPPPLPCGAVGVGAALRGEVGDATLPGVLLAAYVVCVAKILPSPKGYPLRCKAGLSRSAAQLQARSTEAKAKASAIARARGVTVLPVRSGNWTLAANC